MKLFYFLFIYNADHRGAEFFFYVLNPFLIRNCRFSFLFGWVFFFLNRVKAIILTHTHTHLMKEMANWDGKSNKNNNNNEKISFILNSSFEEKSRQLKIELFIQFMSMCTHTQFRTGSSNFPRNFWIAPKIYTFTFAAMSFSFSDSFLLILVDGFNITEWWHAFIARLHFMENIPAYFPSKRHPILGSPFSLTKLGFVHIRVQYTNFD